MANKTITSANSQFLLAIPGVFSSPLPLQGYAADDAFSSEAISSVETSMGVDGKLSAGFAFHPVKMKIKLSPDSPSIALFEAWNAAQVAARDAYFASAVIYLPATGRKYAATSGALTSYKPLPDAKKVLQPQEYEITWESVLPAGM